MTNNKFPKNWIRIVTCVIIITFLPQNIIWAKGPNTLAPDNEHILGEIARQLGLNPDWKWETFIENSSLVQSALKKLTPEEADGLKKFIKKNQGIIPNSAKILFYRELKNSSPVSAKLKFPSFAEEIEALKNQLKDYLIKKLRLKKKDVNNSLPVLSEIAESIVLGTYSIAQTGDEIYLREKIKSKESEEKTHLTRRAIKITDECVYLLTGRDVIQKYLYFTRNEFGYKHILDMQISVNGNPIKIIDLMCHLNMINNMLNEEGLEKIRSEFYLEIGFIVYKDGKDIKCIYEKRKKIDFIKKTEEIVEFIYGAKHNEQNLLDDIKKNKIILADGHSHPPWTSKILNFSKRDIHYQVEDIHSINTEAARGKGNTRIGDAFRRHILIAKNPETGQYDIRSSFKGDIGGVVTRGKSKSTGGKWPILRPLYDRIGTGLLGQAVFPAFLESVLFVGMVSIILSQIFDLFPAVILTQIIWHPIHLFKAEKPIKFRSAFTGDKILISVITAVFITSLAFVTGLSIALSILLYLSGLFIPHFIVSWRTQSGEKTRGKPRTNNSDSLPSSDLPQKARNIIDEIMRDYTEYLDETNLEDRLLLDAFREYSSGIRLFERVLFIAYIIELLDKAENRNLSKDILIKVITTQNRGAIANRELPINRYLDAVYPILIRLKNNLPPEKYSKLKRGINEFKKEFKNSNCQRLYSIRQDKDKEIAVPPLRRKQIFHYINAIKEIENIIPYPTRNRIASFIEKYPCGKIKSLEEVNAAGKETRDILKEIEIYCGTGWDKIKSASIAIRYNERVLLIAWALRMLRPDGLPFELRQILVTAELVPLADISSHKFRKDLRESLEEALGKDHFTQERIDQIMRRGLSWNDGEKIFLENDDVFKAAARALNEVLRKKSGEQITFKHIKAVTEYHEAIHLALRQSRKVIRDVKDGLKSLRRNSQDALFKYFKNQYGEYGDEIKLIEEIIAGYYTEKILINPLELLDDDDGLITIEKIDTRIPEIIETNAGDCIEKIKINKLQYGGILKELNEARAEKKRPLAALPAPMPEGEPEAPAAAEGPRESLPEIPEEKPEAPAAIGTEEPESGDFAKLRQMTDEEIISLAERNYGIVILMAKEAGVSTGIMFNFLKERQILGNKIRPMFERKVLELAENLHGNIGKMAETVGLKEGTLIDLLNRTNLIGKVKKLRQKYYSGLKCRPIKGPEEIIPGIDILVRGMESSGISRVLEVRTKVIGKETTLIQFEDSDIPIPVLLSFLIGRAMVPVTETPEPEKEFSPFIKWIIEHNWNLGIFFTETRRQTGWDDKVSDSEILAKLDIADAVCNEIKLRLENYDGDTARTAGFFGMDEERFINLARAFGALKDKKAEGITEFLRDFIEIKLNDDIENKYKTAWNKYKEQHTKAKIENENAKEILRYWLSEAKLPVSDISVLTGLSEKDAESHMWAYFIAVDGYVRDYAQLKNICERLLAASRDKEYVQWTTIASEENMETKSFMKMLFQFAAFVTGGDSDKMSDFLGLDKISLITYLSKFGLAEMKDNIKRASEKLDDIKLLYEQIKSINPEEKLHDTVMKLRLCALAEIKKELDGLCGNYPYLYLFLNIAEKYYIEPEISESEVIRDLKRQDSLEPLKDKQITQRCIWKVILAYTQLINETCIWAKKEETKGQRNYWGGEIWKIILKEGETGMGILWKQMGDKIGIDDVALKREMFRYFLEAGEGDYTKIVEIAGNRFTKSVVRLEISTLGIFEEFVMAGALAKIKRGEDLDSEESALMIEELLKDAYQKDRTFPAFSFITKTSGSGIGGYIKFYYRRKEDIITIIRLTGGIAQKFGLKTPVRIRTVFTESNGWEVKVTEIDPGTKKDIPGGPVLIFVKIPGKNKYKLKETGIPEGEIAIREGKALIRQMISEDKFGDEDFNPKPFRINARRSSLRGAVYAMLDFGDIHGYDKAYAPKIHNDNFIIGTYYKIDFYFSKKWKQWIGLVYELKDTGEATGKLVTAFTGKKDGGRVKLYQLTDTELEESAGEIGAGDAGAETKEFKEEPPQRKSRKEKKLPESESVITVKDALYNSGINTDVLDPSYKPDRELLTCDDFNNLLSGTLNPDEKEELKVKYMERFSPLVKKCYELTLSGALKKMPHGFWKGEKGRLHQIILTKYFLTEKLGLIIDDKERKIDKKLFGDGQKKLLKGQRVNNWDDLFAKYKLRGLLTYYAPGNQERFSIISVFEKAYPWIFDYDSSEGQHLHYHDFPRVARAMDEDESFAEKSMRHVVEKHWQIINPEDKTFSQDLYPKNHIKIFKKYKVDSWMKLFRKEGLRTVFDTQFQNNIKLLLEKYYPWIFDLSTPEGRHLHNWQFDEDKKWTKDAEMLKNAGRHIILKHFGLPEERNSILAGVKTRALHKEGLSWNMFSHIFNNSLLDFLNSCFPGMFPEKGTFEAFLLNFCFYQADWKNADNKYTKWLIQIAAIALGKKDEDFKTKDLSRKISVLNGKMPSGLLYQYTGLSDKQALDKFKEEILFNPEYPDFLKTFWKKGETPQGTVDRILKEFGLEKKAGEIGKETTVLADQAGMDEFPAEPLKRGSWEKLPVSVHKKFIEKLIEELEMIRKIIKSGEKDNEIIKGLLSSGKGRRLVKQLSAAEGPVKLSNLRNEFFNMQIGRFSGRLLKRFALLYRKLNKKEAPKLAFLEFLFRKLGFEEEKKEAVTTELIEKVIAEEFRTGNIQKGSTLSTINRICGDLGIKRKEKMRDEVARILFTYRFYEILKKVKDEIDRKTEGIKDAKDITRIRKEELRILRSNRFGRYHRGVEARLWNYYGNYKAVYERNKEKIKEIMGFEIEYDRDICGIKDSTNIIAWLKGERGEVPGGFSVHVGKGCIYTLIYTNNIYINLTQLTDLKESDCWMSFEQDKTGNNKYVLIWEDEQSAGKDGASPLHKYQIVKDRTKYAQRWDGKPTERSPIHLIKQESSSVLIRRFLLEDGALPPGFEAEVKGKDIKKYGGKIKLCAFIDFNITLSTYLSGLKGRKLWITFEKDESGNKFSVLWENEEKSRINPYGYLRKYYLVKDDKILNQFGEDSKSTEQCPIIYTWKDHLKVIAEGREIRPKQLARGEEIDFLVSGLLHKDPNIVNNVTAALVEWVNTEAGVSVLINFMDPNDTSKKGIAKNSAILDILESFDVNWPIVAEYIMSFAGYPDKRIRDRSVALRKKLIKAQKITDKQLEKIIRNLPHIIWNARKDFRNLIKLSGEFIRQNIPAEKERLFRIYYKIRFMDYLTKINNEFQRLPIDEKKKNICAKLSFTNALEDNREVVSGINRYYNGYREFFKVCGNEIEKIFGFKIDYYKDISRLKTSSLKGSAREGLKNWVLGKTKEIPSGFYCGHDRYLIILIDSIDMKLFLTKAIYILKKGRKYWLSFSEENKGRDKIASVWESEEDEGRDGAKPVLKFYLVKNNEILAQKINREKTRKIPELIPEKPDNPEELWKIVEEYISKNKICMWRFIAKRLGFEKSELIRKVIGYLLAKENGDLDTIAGLLKIDKHHLLYNYIIPYGIKVQGKEIQKRQIKKPRKEIAKREEIKEEKPVPEPEKLKKIDISIGDIWLVRFKGKEYHCVVVDIDWNKETVEFCWILNVNGGKVETLSPLVIPFDELEKYLEEKLCSGKKKPEPAAKKPAPTVKVEPVRPPKEEAPAQAKALPPRPAKEKVPEGVKLTIANGNIIIGKTSFPVSEVENGAHNKNLLSRITENLFSNEAQKTSAQVAGEALKLLKNEERVIDILKALEPYSWQRVVKEKNRILFDILDAIKYIVGNKDLINKIIRRLGNFITYSDIDIQKKALTLRVYFAKKDPSKTPAGFIRRGDKSRREFASKLDEIRQNDITREYKNRIQRILDTNPNLTPKIRTYLDNVIKNYRIYGFKSITKEENDFFLGWNNTTDNELFIALDVISELEVRGPPTLADEYILHEILCPIMDHYPAILAQQKIFPQHYPDEKKLREQTEENPYRGLLGIALGYIIIKTLQIELSKTLLPKIGDIRLKMPDEEELLSILDKGKLTAGSPGLVTAMRKDGIIDDEDFEIITKIGKIVEEVFKDFSLTDNQMALLTEAISIKYLIDKAGLDKEFKERIRNELNRAGYGSKAKIIITLLEGLKYRLKKDGGRFSKLSHYDFIKGLEDLLGNKEISGVIGVKEKPNLNSIRGNGEDSITRHWADIFESNPKQWEVLELPKDKIPTGIIIQDIKDLGPGVQNWLEGIRRRNIDMSGTKMGYITEGLSEAEVKKLETSKSENAILGNSLEEIKKKTGAENVVYLASSEKLNKYKNTGAKLVKKGRAGPVIELNLCLSMLNADNIKEVYREFLNKLSKLEPISKKQIDALVNEMDTLGYIKLPEIKKVLDMWNELQEGVSYLDIWV